MTITPIVDTLETKSIKLMGIRGGTMARTVNSITELIGDTPAVKLNRIVDEDSADVYLKLEFMNPGSSVKDRIALAMIEAAEKAGKLKPGDTIVERQAATLGSDWRWSRRRKDIRLYWSCRIR
ncbi:Beta-cyano-L-alanine synthase [Geobacillus sp. WSUCF1]|nr:Beta-cyano-L-alanine synthase [Geobacillus sp. WSUCF1]